MTEVDSANYTCEVSAPASAELGVVKYRVYVRGKCQCLVIESKQLLSHSLIASRSKRSCIECILIIDKILPQISMYQTEGSWLIGVNFLRVKQN